MSRSGVFSSNPITRWLVVPLLASLALLMDGAPAHANHPGCSIQCLDHGKLFPGTTSVKVELGTSSPAILDVFVGGRELPALTVLADPEAKVSSKTRVQRWTGTVTGLRSGTKYQLIVRATDVHGSRAFQKGDFTTKPAKTGGNDGIVPPSDQDHISRVMVSFDQVHVISDGDTGLGKFDKGEISFDFSVNGQTRHRGEKKIDSGDRVGLGDDFRFTVEDPPDLIELYVRGVDDDRGKCIVESGETGGADGFGCHWAEARMVLDLTDDDADGDSLPHFAFRTGDEHLEFEVIGHFEVDRT